MSAFADRIMLEITLDDAPLCDEYGDSIFDEAGNDIYLEQPGFVDVWPDTLASRDVEFSYGLSGSKLTDRVADIGTIRFRLNNSASNSAGLAGYYSPDHANFRGGLQRETPIKLTFEEGGVRYVKWRGYARTIEPLAGIYGDRYVDIDGEDVIKLLDDFAEMNLQAIQTNATSDELYATIEGFLTRRFPTTSFSPNSNTLTYGFDTATRQKSTARNEIFKIAQSVMDYVFAKGDTYEGGKLTSQTYADRISDQTNDFTLTDSLIKELTLERAEMIDRAVAIIHPRQIGDSNEVLYTLNVAGAGNAQAIYPGESITFTANYRDPNQTSARIAAQSIVTPVATTDYKLGRGNGDNSADMNTNATITLSPASGGATSVDVTIANGHASRTMYVNFFQLRGIAIRQFEMIERAVDVDNPLGDVELRLDLVYEDDVLAAQAIAELAALIHASGFSVVRDVTFNANKSATLLGYAMTVEPGMRGAISEAQTGISQNGFVNGVRGRIYGKEFIDISFVMELAQPVSGQFWLLGKTGHGELEDETYIFGV